MHLSTPDYLIIGIYFTVVLSVGFMIKYKIKTTNDFLMSSRSVPLWITSLAFISANLGAQEVIGMAASGAKYGIMTSHFYWVGAIPAMVFVAVFMMPFYYGSKARSGPGVSQIAVRRKNARPQRHDLRRHDGLFLGHF